MKVVNPETTTHTTKLIPRFALEDGFNAGITLQFTNETTKESSDVTGAPVYTDGILSIQYDFTFVDKSKYSIKIYNDEGVIYRGKAIATTQEAEDYKLTKDLYFYE